MKGDVASSRRRRRPSATTQKSARSEMEKSPSPGTGDYYDDNDESDSDVKGNRGSHDERMYGSACSLGQFVLNPCRCLCRCGHKGWMRITRYWNYSTSILPLSKTWHKQQRHTKAINTVDFFLVGAIVTFSLVSLYCLLPIPNLERRLMPHRPPTDHHVNRIPLILPCFDFQKWNLDIGGWQFFHHFFVPKSPLEDEELSIRDYDGIEFVGVFGQPRVVRPDEEQVREKYLQHLRTRRGRIPMYAEHDEDTQDEPQQCRRQNWAQLYNPSCNAIQEIDLGYDFKETRAGLGDDQMFDTFYISHGYWRDVWVVDQVQQKVKSILKMSRWEHPNNMEIFWYILHDALVMERLTKSPRIVDIFGHCGYTVWVEAISYEVEEVVVPGDGFIKQEDLHDEQQLQPKNEYTDEQKLDMALAMAESIADLHGFEDGLIVHDDIQLCQWLQTRDGQLKLGDFNRAEFPMFDVVKQDYCKYNNGHGYGNYRSPEEFAAHDLDEKIDVFSFGNNIYSLLTGLWVFYENEDDGVVQTKLRKGETAFVDERYRTQSFISGKLVEVMEKCWAYDAKDRIDIFEAVRLLREAKEEHEKRKQEEKLD